MPALCCASTYARLSGSCTALVKCVWLLALIIRSDVMTSHVRYHLLPAFAILNAVHYARAMAEAPAQKFYLLQPEAFQTYLGEDLSWAQENVPFFESDDVDITSTFYFRWRVYRKHIKFHAEVGHVVTEFLPDVSWAGPYNTISATAGHHIYEGRWLHDASILDDYSRFWVSDIARPHDYTSWLANAISARYMVDGRLSLLKALLPGLQRIFQGWVEANFVAEEGCFFSSDTADGGEDSISGDGCRASINAIMYGELQALASMQSLLGQHAQAADSLKQAKALQERTLQLLWRPDMQFLGTYKTQPPASYVMPPSNSRCAGAPEWPPQEVVPVRESLALSAPYFFSMVPKNAKHVHAMWQQVWDKGGFAARWGPRTAELRSPHYNFSCDHPCTWNGPSWPFETCRLIGALATFLNDYPAQDGLGKQRWYELMVQYARVHTQSHPLEPSDEHGNPVPSHPWIGEDIHPDDGYWIARQYMYRQQEGDWRRGYAYLHSTFCDLIITGLVGLRPQANATLLINPLVPSSTQWFALDNLLYHGTMLCIFWDQHGRRYGHGKGLHVWAEGQLLAHSPVLAALTTKLPSAAAST